MKVGDKHTIYSQSQDFSEHRPSCTSALPIVLSSSIGGNFVDGGTVLVLVADWKNNQVY